MFAPTVGRNRRLPISTLHSCSIIYICSSMAYLTISTLIFALHSILHRTMASLQSHGARTAMQVDSAASSSSCSESSVKYLEYSLLVCAPSLLFASNSSQSNSPKYSFVVPNPVLGGVTTFLFASVVASGTRVLSYIRYTRRDRFILAAAFSFGIGDLLLPEVFTHLFDGVDHPNKGLQGLFDSITIVLSTPCKQHFYSAFKETQLI